MEEEVVLKELEALHFHCKPKWLQQCLQFLRSQTICTNLLDAVVDQFLHTDLSVCYTTPLKIPTQAAKAIINKRIIFQVLSSIDISRSCYEQLAAATKTTRSLSWFTGELEREEQANVPSSRRMLKLEITDGETKLFALEYIQQVFKEDFVKPGTKFILTENVKCRRGILFIDNLNCQVLGGNVDSLAYDPVEMMTKFFNIDLGAEAKRRASARKKVEEQMLATMSASSNSKHNLTQSSISPFVVRQQRTTVRSSDVSLHSTSKRPGDDLNISTFVSTSFIAPDDPAFNDVQSFCGNKVPNEQSVRKNPVLEVPQEIYRKIVPLTASKHTQEVSEADSTAETSIRSQKAFPQGILAERTTGSNVFKNPRVSESRPVPNPTIEQRGNVNDSCSVPMKWKPVKRETAESLLSDCSKRESLATVKELGSSEEQRRTIETISGFIHGPRLVSATKQRGSNSRRLAQDAVVSRPITNYFNPVKGRLQDNEQNTNEKMHVSASSPGSLLDERGDDDLRQTAHFASAFEPDVMTFDQIVELSRKTPGRPPVASERFSRTPEASENPKYSNGTIRPDCTIVRNYEEEGLRECERFGLNTNDSSSVNTLDPVAIRPRSSRYEQICSDEILGADTWDLDADCQMVPYRPPRQKLVLSSLSTPEPMLAHRATRESSGMLDQLPVHEKGRESGAFSDRLKPVSAFERNNSLLNQQRSTGTLHGLSTEQRDMEHERPSRFSTHRMEIARADRLMNDEKTPTKRANPLELPTSLVALKRVKAEVLNSAASYNEIYDNNLQYRQQSKRVLRQAEIEEFHQPPTMYRISSREDPAKSVHELMRRYKELGVVFLLDVLANRKFWIISKKVVVVPTMCTLASELRAEGREWRQQVFVSDTSANRKLCDISTQLLDRLFGFTVHNCEKLYNSKEMEKLRKYKDHAAEVLSGFNRLDLVIWLDVAPYVDKIPVVVDVKTMADALNIL